MIHTSSEIVEIQCHKNMSKLFFRMRQHIPKKLLRKHCQFDSLCDWQVIFVIAF